MKPPQSVISRVREWQLTDKMQKVQAKKRLNGTGGEAMAADEFVALLYEHGGSAYAMAKACGLTHKVVAMRRQTIEDALEIVLPRGRPETWRRQAHRKRVDVHVDDAQVLVFSDVHAWPEVYGVAMAGIVDLNRKLKPDIVILNGDGFDGAQISRHARLGWDSRPTPAEEIEALSDFLEQVRKANPNARYIRSIGNHCSRFETYLSSNAPAVEGMKGTTLSDHLPGWEECMGIYVNNPECTIKHRGRHNGIHATYNELRRRGASFVHGHLHRQKCVHHGNAHGDIWGVDLGMTAPRNHPGFDYMELDVEEWVSGFGVLTFVDGKLQQPDLATVVDEDRGLLKFGGEIIKYDL
jgi:hypothetical protein